MPERLVTRAARAVERSEELDEVQAQRIGEMVMEGLKALDPVAYIRFASVYKDFREAKDFEQFAGSFDNTGSSGTAADQDER